MLHTTNDYITSITTPSVIKKGSRQDIVAAIRAALPALFKAGQVIEIRAIRVDGKKQIASGYFDDLDKLAQAAALYDGRAQAIYFTLNPVNSALIARANNRIKAYAETTTSDHDIIQRTWFGLDFDPVRPADISSTDEEHQAALDRAWQCLEWLREQGWPAPFYADSGNGAHLLYAIDLPNDEGSVALLKAVLATLAARFDDRVIEVDPAVFNASRVWKLYGTLACKGDDIPDRPHRRATILKAPSGTPQIVPRELLEILAAQAPKDEIKYPSPTRQAKASSGASSDHTVLDTIKNTFDLVAYAQKHFPGGIKQESKNEVRVLGNGGMLINTEKQTWYHFANGKGGDALDLVGYIRYGTGWDHTNKMMFQDAMREAAHEVGLSLPERTQPAPANGQKPQGDPTILQAVAQPAPVPSQNAAPRKSTLLQLDDLKKLPKPTWLIDGEIPDRGLTVLCGKSGIGKSFIMLEYAHQLIRAGKKVVYLGLEGKFGFKARINALNQHYKVSEETVNTYLRFCFDPISLMVPEDVNAFIAAVREFGPCMVVIDTLSRAIPPGDPNKPRDMQMFVNACQRIQEAIDGTVCVVHHSRKSDDVFSGAGNLFNSSDTFISVKNFDGLISIEAEKVKDAEPLPTRYMRLMPVRLEDGSETPIVIKAEKIVQTQNDKLYPNQRKVLETLAEIFDGVSQLCDLVEVTEIGKGSLLRTLGTLKKLNYVAQPKPFGPYHITVEGLLRVGATPKRDSVNSPDSSPLDEMSPAVSPSLPTRTLGSREKSSSLKDENSFFENLGESDANDESLQPIAAVLHEVNTPYPSSETGPLEVVLPLQKGTREQPLSSEKHDSGSPTRQVSVPQKALTFGVPMPTYDCPRCRTHTWQPRPGGKWVCQTCEDIRAKDQFSRKGDQI